MREGLDQVIRVRYDEETGSSVVERDEGGDGSPVEPEDVYDLGAA